MAAWRIQGQRAHKPGSSGTEHERGATSRALRVQATRFARETGQEGKRQDKTVKYVPRWRDQHGGGRKNGARQRYAAACTEAGTKTPVETAGHGPQTKCTAHAGRAGHNAASAAHGAQVEERDGGKARDTMPSAVEKCPTRQSQSPARRQQRPYASNPTPAAPLADALGVIRRDVGAPVST